MTDCCQQWQMNLKLFEYVCDVGKGPSLSIDVILMTICPLLKTKTVNFSGWIGDVKMFVQNKQRHRTKNLQEAKKSAPYFGQ